MACCDSDNPKPTTIAHGAAGLAKAMLHIGRAPEATIQARRDICRDCPQATRNEARVDRPTKGLTALSVCLACKPYHCTIKGKTANASEACPDGRWPADA